MQTVVHAQCQPIIKQKRLKSRSTYPTLGRNAKFSNHRQQNLCIILVENLLELLSETTL